ncbi:MAG TPA: ABC transporter ATP-binding protein [Anaerolineae bacterium]|nr:ABC transporter ATP-binding protein [Anaerolineae bacterium]
MAAIFRGLDAEAYDRQYNDRELLNRIFQYFSPYRRQWFIIILCAVYQSIAGAGAPILIAEGVNIMADNGDPTLIPYLIFAVFFLGTSNWGINWVRRRNTSEVLQDVILNIRGDAFAAAAQQDLSFYDKFSSGRIVSRITSDTTDFSQVVELSTDIFNQVTTALILIIYLFTIEVRLTLTVLSISPILVIAALGFRRLARRVTRQASRAIGEVNKAVQEVVTGIGVAKNFRQEATIYNDFTAVNQQVYGINVRRGFVMANIFPTLSILSGFATAALVYFGGLSAAISLITISAWYLFVATIDRFWFPVINISSFWSQFQAGLAAIERVFALMDTEPTVKQTASNPVPPLKGKISFQNIAFRYTEQEQILTNFSLDIPAGETIAIVGHTGAGKSSLIRLVARFYEFQAGQLFIDDHDIRTFDLAAYRQQLGIVSQVPFLFDGTIADNIRYGQPDITDDAILAMARRIGNGEWLDTLPQGLNSHVGERGSRLSMGQRQLVALIRVLVQKPSIFILDEATASIDPFTESQIQEALDLIMKQTTAIVIAHRLSTVRAADRIIVLSQGDIIEQGNHDQLMAQAGHYANLYDTYFRHQSLSYINSKGWEQTAVSPPPPSP